MAPGETARPTRVEIMIAAAGGVTAALKNAARYGLPVEIEVRTESELREALAAGKHVYAEKPLAEDSATALELARLARDAGLRNGVVQDKELIDPRPWYQYYK